MVRKRLLFIFILTEILLGVPIIWGTLIGAFGYGAGVALLLFPAINLVTAILFFIGLRKYRSGNATIFTYIWTFGIYFLLNDLMIGLLFYDLIWKLSR